MAEWILYYEIMWTVVTNPDNKWTHFIDPNFDEHHADIFVNNWFIQKQSTFGNTKWITKYILLPFIVIIYSTLYFSKYISSETHYFTFMFWVFLTCTLIGVVRSKIPSKKIEIFQIKKHTDRMLRIGLSFAFCFTVYVIIKSFVITPNYELTLILPFQFLFALHYFLGGIAATRYVLAECGLLTKTAPKRDISIIASIGSSFKLDMESPKTSSSTTQYLSLSRILRQKMSFDAFMSHLMKEFSSETLLCILECLQFKAMIKALNYKRKTHQQNVCDTDDDDEDLLTNYVGFHDFLLLNEALFDVSLPEEEEEMPQSVIVYDSDCKVEQRAQRLIEKYVYSPNGNCIFEINISSSCKYEMIKKAAALDETVFNLQDLYDLFDAVLLELLRLLNDSHSRFMRTNEYKQLIAHHIMMDGEDN